MNGNKGKDNRFYAVLAAGSALLMVLSILPIVIISWFDYPTGDDIGYSAALRQVLVRGGSVADALRAIISEVIRVYHSWQGTWSSVILFQLQPGIWGHRWYALTPITALLCIMGGSWCLIKLIMIDLMKIDRKTTFIIYSFLMICSIQYLPYMRGGMFWYTSVAHYIIPYGVTMLMFAGSVRFVMNGSVLIYIGLLAGMTYLGGAGYPEIMMTFMWFAFLIFFEVTGITSLRNRIAEQDAGRGDHNRAWMLILPVVLEMAGTAVSAVAPGNKNRGGEQFGFSVGRAFGSVASALRMGTESICQAFVNCRLLVFLVAGTILLIVFTYHPESKESKIKSPVFSVLAAWLLCCAAHAPEAFAGVEVSGGVPDSYYLISALMITLCTAQVTCRLKQMFIRRQEQRDENKEKNAAVPKSRGVRYVIRIAFLSALLIYSFLYRSEIVLPTVDYTCFTFAASGQLRDFEFQMQERLKILENDAISDAVVPEMSDQQGPFMHMALLPDPDTEQNLYHSRYYGKESVRVVPRDEFYEKYADQMLGNEK